MSQIVSIRVEEHRVNLPCPPGADHPTSASETQSGHPANTCQLHPRRGASRTSIQKVAAGGSQSIQCPQPHFLLTTGFGVMARLVMLSPTVPAFTMSKYNALPTGKAEALARSIPGEAQKVKVLRPFGPGRAMPQPQPRLKSAPRGYAAKPLRGSPPAWPRHLLLAPTLVHQGWGSGRRASSRDFNRQGAGGPVPPSRWAGPLP